MIHSSRCLSTRAERIRVYQSVWSYTDLSLLNLRALGFIMSSIDMLLVFISFWRHDPVCKQWCLKVNVRDSSFWGMGFFWSTLLLMGARWKPSSLFGWCASVWRVCIQINFLHFLFTMLIKRRHGMKHYSINCFKHLQLLICL